MPTERIHLVVTYHNTLDNYAGLPHPGRKIFENDPFSHAALATNRERLVSRAVVGDGSVRVCASRWIEFRVVGRTAAQPMGDGAALVPTRPPRPRLPLADTIRGSLSPRARSVVLELRLLYRRAHRVSGHAALLGRSYRLLAGRELYLFYVRFYAMLLRPRITFLWPITRSYIGELNIKGSVSGSLYPRQSWRYVKDIWKIYVGTWVIFFFFWICYLWMKFCIWTIKIIVLSLLRLRFGDCLDRIVLCY